MAACSTCNRTFTCGLRETTEPCWCASLPPIASVDATADCLCPECLRAKLARDGTGAGNAHDADDSRVDAKAPAASTVFGRAASALTLIAFLLSTLIASIPTPAFAAPPTPEAIIKACDEADSASQCERVLEREQLKQFPGLATRNGPALRIATNPGTPAVELKDSGNPDDESADFKWHSFWDYWAPSKIAIVSVTTRDADHFLVMQLDRAMQVKVPSEPILSPDARRFLVSDFCDKGCGNQIQMWRLDGMRAVREKTFKPRERWYETDVSWRDASTLVIEYSVAGPRRRLADPGEVNLVKAEPMTLRLSDSGWISDEPRR